MSVNVLFCFGVNQLLAHAIVSNAMTSLLVLRLECAKLRLQVTIALKRRSAAMLIGFVVKFLEMSDVSSCTPSCEYAQLYTLSVLTTSPAVTCFLSRTLRVFWMSLSSFELVMRTVSRSL